MKSETLRTLLMDRAYGELTPETEELLDAYLRHEPDAAREARSMAEALLLAKRASAVVREREQLPAPRWLNAAYSEETQRRPWYSVPWLAYAACIAGGVLIGSAIIQTWQRPATQPLQVATSMPSQLQLSQERGGGTRFWSSANPLIDERAAGRRSLNRPVAQTGVPDAHEGVWRRNR